MADEVDETIELKASLAATGEFIATLKLPASATVRDLCQAAVNAAASGDATITGFRLLLSGRLPEDPVPLEALQLRSGMLVDLLRCRAGFVATRSADGTLKVWNSATGECATTLEASDHVSEHGFYSPDRQRILRLNKSSTAQLCNAEGRCLEKLTGHKDIISTAAFSLDGRAVATASNDCTAKVWVESTAWCRHTLQGHTAELTSVAFGPDGRVVTSSLDKTARVWADGKCSAVLSGHSWAVNSAAFSSAGKLVVTSSDDRTAKVWDATTGECLRTLEGHKGPVLGAVFME